MLSRKLPYPLQNAEYPEQGSAEEDVSAMAWSSEDNEERVWIALFLSLNEYVKIASCVDVGRDIAYPEESFNVWWLWQEIYKVANFCAAVADCIENSDAVNSALANWFVNALETNTDMQNALNAFNNFPSDYQRGKSLPETYTSQDIGTPYNPTCDLDITWAQCLGLVDETNFAIRDVLEKFEVLTNSAELINALSNAIPALATALNAIGKDGWFQLFNYYQQAFSEQYLAQYTETTGGTRDQLACALFCACKIDCVITIDRIQQALEDRLATYLTAPPLTTFADLITFLAGVDQDDTFVCDLAFYAAWSILKTGNYLFGGIAGDVIEIVTEIYADEPSNNWSTLCTSCGWTYTKHFNISLGDWSVQAGTWIEGTGVQNDTGSAFPYTVQVGIGVADWGTSELSNWRINAYSSAADGGAFRGMVYVTSGVPTYQDIGGGETGNYNLEGTAAEPYPDEIYAQISNASVPGTNIVISITLSGLGTMPTWIEL